MEALARLDEYLTEHAGRFEEELCELLRIPSVSADPAFHDDVRRAGDWVANRLARLGLTVETFETPGNPIVFARSASKPGKPTVLVYGHYDVQPPDPLDQWQTPPFEPTRRDGNIHARGATDDKGQMLTHINGAEAWIETVGELPINLLYLIEGEEEVGGENLDAFLATHKETLACDCAVISDTCQFAPGRPAITYGLRGMAYFELRLTGPNQDLHSGTFGGAVTNPVNTLAKMLASLVDEQGRVQVPGFYDDVAPLTDEERSQFSALGFDEAAFMAQIGVDGLSGEDGFTTLERRWARPTCDVNGVWGGYQGEGAKTIVPATAGAKFSFRLVPDQDPEAITRSLKDMLAKQCPAGIDMELIEFHTAPGVVVNWDSLFVEAARKAVAHGFGAAPVMIREGGSIPVVGALKQLLGVDTLLLGWGLNDDNTHSPNEKFSLADFHRGIKSSCRLWHEIASLDM